MKLLVTGANGFLGKSLCAALCRHNFLVVAASRSPVLLTKCVTPFVIGELENAFDWRPALQGVEVVVHLAARVHVMQDRAKNPLQAFLDVNLQGTVNLAQAAAKAGIKRFVFLSSIKVNGEFTDKNPFKECDMPQPQDAYAMSKLEAEIALRKIEKETGMQVVVVRPPLVYGAEVKANFASLLKLVNKKLPLPLASINAKRSLIYVGNLVDAIIACASHPKAAGQTYLVSDNEDVPMPQLIKKIANALNKPSYLLPFPVSFIRLFAKAVGRLSIADRLTQPLVIDCSKIRQQLGWNPPFTIDQGLKVTADWYLQSLKKDRD